MGLSRTNATSNELFAGLHGPKFSVWARDMTRRRAYILLVLSAMTVAVYLWCHQIVGDPIPWTAFFRIDQGMPQGEVRSLLGKPSRTNGDILIWDGSNGTVAVAF